MNKTALTSFTILCLVSTALLLGLKTSVNANPGIIYVPDDYPTIAEALLWANDRDIIYVRSGIYNESIHVGMNLTLIGENKDSTIIDGGGAQSVIRVQSPYLFNPYVDVFITNFTIRNGDYGILNDFMSRNVTIVENIIANNSLYGIYLRHSSNCTISSNVIIDTGIKLEDSANFTINENNIINTTTQAISLAHSDHNIISENNITDSHVEGIYVIGGSTENEISRNRIAEIEVNPGINIQNGTENAILENLILNCMHSSGVFCWGDANVMRGNTVENCTGGIIIDGDNNTVEVNTIKHGVFLGINLAGGENTLVCDNDVINCTAGIHLETIFGQCNNNKVIANTISKSSWVGLLVRSSSNNTFFHNNFVDNTMQKDVDASDNVWDNGAEGNYWSDYNGTDFDHDGIGDVPYEIDSNNNDTCPLMGMFHSFTTSLSYCVNIISNSTIESFEYFESNRTIRMIVSNMTVNQTLGFCRVCVPHTLMNPDEISVIIDDGQTPILYHNYTLHDNGTHRWIYFAYEHSTHRVVISDTTLPTISILSPENKTYDVSDVPLTFTVSELTSWIGYSLDGANNVTITGNTTIPIPVDGSHHVVVYANDTVGNVGASDIIYFTVDTTPPNITEVSQLPPEDNVLPDDEVRVNATITDDVSGVKQVILNCTTNNGTWFSQEMTNLQGNLYNGTIPEFPYCTNVTYVVIAEDNANNTITTVEMEYEYQYHVIPEFPSFMILPLFMIASLLAVIVYKRKHSMCNNRRKPGFDL